MLLKLCVYRPGVDPGAGGKLWGRGPARYRDKHTTNSAKNQIIQREDALIRSQFSGERAAPDASAGGRER